jgi:uncharacterized protein YjdB
MKKNFSFVAGLLLSIAATAAAPVATDYAGGDGTEGNPYQIATRAQLEKLVAGDDGAGVHYRLTADIDLSGSNWTPIGNGSGTTNTPFRGKLHGGNHLIKNISINNPSSGGSNHVSFLGSIGAGARVDSLHIVGGSIYNARKSQPTRTAGIAGQAILAADATEGIAVVACSNSARIISENNYAATGNELAGIIGQISNASTTYGVVVEYCFNSVDLGNRNGGGFRTAGIVGHTTGAGVFHIKNCYSHGILADTATSNSCAVGGIIGRSEATGSGITIDNCYAAGAAFTVATEAYNVGGILGRLASGTVSNCVALQDTLRTTSTDKTHNFRVRGYTGGPTLTNNYANANMVIINGSAARTNLSSTSATSENGANITLAQAQSQSFYATNLSTWDFTSVWAIREGASYPYFQYQSAPVVVEILYNKSVTLNLVNAAESVLVYKGANRELLTTLTSVSAGNSAHSLTGVSAGDVLYFVTYEAGKAPSYAVSGVALQYVDVSGVTLDKATETVSVSGSATLTATVNPSNANNKALTWSSSDNTVATVTPGGDGVSATVTGVSPGTATITVTSDDNSNATAACVLTVQAGTIAVTGVALSQTTLALAAGDSATLTATVAPGNATDRSVSWHSNNPAAATVSVDAEGVATVKAIATGAAAIVVTTTDGSFTDTCKVTVRVPVTGVAVAPRELRFTLEVDATPKSLAATVAPANADNKAVTWTSRNAAVATFNSATDSVTPVGQGVTYIVVETADGSYRDSARVTVLAAPRLTGLGTSDAPYQIATRDDLLELDTYVGELGKGLHFKLTADIELGEWTPVGSAASPFMGKLHGDGHKLLNISIDGGTTVTHLGLFAALGAGAYIENVHIVRGEIKNGATAVYAGGIAAYAECSVAAGQTDSIVIVGCSNSANINTTGRESNDGTPGVGGIVGKVNSPATGGNANIILRNVANTGKITSGSYVAGGLIGRAATGAAAGSKATLLVTNSYSNATVAVSRDGSNRAGGLVGYLGVLANGEQIITYSYATGGVSAATTGSGTPIAGGIAAASVDGAGTTMKILNCVSAHEFVNAGNYGRRIMYIDADNYKPETYQLNNYAYADMVTTGTPASSISTGAGLNKTMGELHSQATYATGLSWDFTNTWAIREGKSFPYFKGLSAPVFVGEVHRTDTLQLDVEATADSVVAYKGDSRKYVGTLTANFGSSYSYNISGWDVQSDDVLYLVCYQPGLKPSVEISVKLDAGSFLYQGTGTESDPYLVPNRAALAAMVYHLGAANAGEHFRLTADIDLTGSSWEPIGSDVTTKRFYGKLHGGGHKIKNISVNVSAKPRAGLFATLGEGAYVDSLHIVGGTITNGVGNGRSGAIAGVADAKLGGSIVIRSCSNSAHIAVSSTTGFGGGIVGGITTSGGSTVTIASCFNSGSITGSGNALGGIAGATNDVTLSAATNPVGNTGKVNIVDCYSVAAVKVSKNVSDGSHGGILGYAYTSEEGQGYHYSDTVNITGCYAAGTVEVINTNTAGSGSGNAGGITGNARGQDTATWISINNSVAAQSKLVTTKSNYRIIGYLQPSVRWAVSNSYANGAMTVNGKLISAGLTGPASGHGESKTVAELQQEATYATGLGWDFTGTWAIRDGKSYPYFQWQSAPVVVSSVATGEATVTLDVPAGIDSLEVYTPSGSGSNDRTLAATVVSPSASHNLSTSTLGNLFYVVSYAAGKQASYPVEVNIIPVTGVTLSATSIDIEPDSTFTLTATVAPADATTPAVTWTSLDPSIATVANGVVTGVAVGDVRIVVTTADGGYTDTCKVTVRAHVFITGVTLAKQATTINKNLTETLTCTVYPIDAQNRDVTWRSLDPSIATVGETGLVTAVEEGVTKIIVTTVEGGFSDTCEVTVSIVHVTGISVAPKQILNILVGGSAQQISVTVEPANATDKSVTWVSRDSSIAAVSNIGVVSAKKAGEVYIVAVAVDGGLSDSCRVTVRGGSENTGVAQAQAFFAVYPNPVKAGQPVNIVLPEGVGAATVRIFDLKGTLVRQESGVRQATAPTHTGMYLLQVELPGGATSVQRILVE